MKQFIFDYWQIMLGALGTGGAFWQGFKIKKANDRKAELENIQLVRDMEKALMEDMKKQVAELITNNARLETIVTEQQKIIRKYVNKYGEL